MKGSSKAPFASARVCQNAVAGEDVMIVEGHAHGAWYGASTTFQADIKFISTTLEGTSVNNGSMHQL